MLNNNLREINMIKRNDEEKKEMCMPEACSSYCKI